ncbi:MAG: flavin reductase family protein [Novosphingobium sp.]|uniref:flavin reductase family protein n=1 Tax=Thauera propionica TaxID=2019431 RepID=UPI0023F51F6E|nr:flavin reductase family protein [Thauera propionica]MDD3674779.1 flavin reductase family protein [Thauera propionica]
MKQQVLQEDFKQGMRRLASTVAVVTTGKNGQWSGMAATAVSSVSSDPPTLLVVVNRSSSLAAALAERDSFCVNLLSGRHEELVDAFGGKLKGQDRFRIGNWEEAEEGPPELADALASFMCRIANKFSVATHDIYIGSVERVSFYDMIDPLVWLNGRMASVEKEQKP